MWIGIEFDFWNIGSKITLVRFFVFIFLFTSASRARCLIFFSFFFFLLLDFFFRQWYLIQSYLWIDLAKEIIIGYKWDGVKHDSQTALCRDGWIRILGESWVGSKGATQASVDIVV